MKGFCVACTQELPGEGRAVTPLGKDPSRTQSLLPVSETWHCSPDMGGTHAGDTTCSRGSPSGSEGATRPVAQCAYSRASGQLACSQMGSGLLPSVLYGRRLRGLCWNPTAKAALSSPWRCETILTDTRSQTRGCGTLAAGHH